MSEGDNVMSVRLENLNTYLYRVLNFLFIQKCFLSLRFVALFYNILIIGIVVGNFTSCQICTYVYIF